MGQHVRQQVLVDIRFSAALNRRARLLSRPSPDTPVIGADGQPKGVPVTRVWVKSIFWITRRHVPSNQRLMSSQKAEYQHERARNDPHRSIFWANASPFFEGAVPRLPVSIATGRGKLQVQPCPH